MEVETVALAAHRVAHPELGDLIDQILERLNNKLYKQLTDLLIEYVNQPCFRTGTELVPLFDETIAGLETKINPLKFVQLLTRVAKQKTNEEALEFIEPFGAKDVVTKDLDAKLYWSITKAEKSFLEGKAKEAKDLLDEAEKKLDESLGLETTTRSYYHITSAGYYKLQKDHRNYYKSLLLYLNYTAVDKIPAEERMPLAFNIGVALIVAEKEFDFGELLQQELVTSLKEGGPEEKKWIVQLLEAFCEGTFDLFDKAMAEHKAKIDGCSDLKEAEAALRRKMTQCALMEMVFQRPAKERRVAFAEVAQHCRVEPKQVEFLLMKAMNEKLVRGVIDGVDQSVNFSWVKPRILDTQRIMILRDRVDSCTVQAKTLMASLEEMTPELMVS